MDIKSMAKSKRSHTKHNQPRKPNHQTLKPTSNHPPNPQNKKPEPQKPVHQKPSLPSNWDRYDEDVDDEFGLHVPGSNSGGVAEEFKVKVKSKGADFGYLIELAKENNRHLKPTCFGDSIEEGQGRVFEPFTSPGGGSWFACYTRGFTQNALKGVAPMLDVKSEGISWEQDDDFLQENEETSEEAPNFSLDLKALAEVLEKTDFAKRLFIEPDLVPLELRGQEGNENSNPIPKRRPKTFETFEELYSIYLADEKIAESEAGNKDDTISSSDGTNDSKSGYPCQPIQMVEKDTKIRITELGHNLSHVTDQASMPELRVSVPPADDVSKPDTTPSRLLRDDSEADLDTLLNSIGKINLSNSQGNLMSNLMDKPVIHQPSQNASSLDDDLDDLLGASNLSKKSDWFKSVEVSASPKYPLRPVVPVSSCGLDDELDNLLEETSKPAEVKVNQLDFPPSSSHHQSKPAVLDDFDSWLDTL